MKESNPRTFYSPSVFKTVPLPTLATYHVSLKGVEPLIHCGHQILSLTCIPVPPQRHVPLVGLEPTQPKSSVPKTEVSTVPP